MKRSKSIKLVVMATTTVTIAGCSDEPTLDGRVYKTEAECVADSYVPDEVCVEAITAGKSIHKASGPRYDTVNLCNEQHGNNVCAYDSATDGSSYYTPFPAGYFPGRGTDRRRYQPTDPEQRPPGLSGTRQQTLLHIRRLLRRQLWRRQLAYL